MRFRLHGAVYRKGITMASDTPKRAFAATIKVQGDTRDEMLRLLLEFQSAIEEGINDRVSGGCAAGGWLQVEIDERITPAKYQEQLAAYKAFNEAMKF